MAGRFKTILKASIPGVQATFHQLHHIRHFNAFAAVSVQLKKPSGGPKGLSVPHAMGLTFHFFFDDSFVVRFEAE
jgi:hypothetical protein